MRISQMVKQMRGEGIACSKSAVYIYLKGKRENRFTSYQYKRVFDYIDAVYHEEVRPHFKRKSDMNNMITGMKKDGMTNAAISRVLKVTRGCIEYRLKGMAKNEK